MDIICHVGFGCVHSCINTIYSYFRMAALGTVRFEYPDELII